ncbi:MAG: CoA transferase [Pseudomonadales bacterium]|nr:CoA transferase [Pseudomonadales bacterium]
MKQSAEPLSGFTVLEMTTALQGLGAGLYLRDMGADVIKVEPPLGDSARYHRGINNGTPPESQVPGFVAVNRGKKSICIDIHSPAGREVISRLLEKSDVFLSNYRSRFLASMQLDYPSIAAQYPHIVYAQVNGFGHKGPDKDKAMLDGVAQARGGLASVSGVAGQTPMPPGAAIADMAGAMQLALGTMTGLLARERHGIGQKVETSSLGAQLWLQMWELQHYMITGVAVKPSGSHIDNIKGPYGVYDTNDGGCFTFAHAMDEESWDALCIFAEMFELIGHSDWNTPGKRLGSSGQGAEPEWVRSIMQRGFGSKSTQQWNDFMYSQPGLIMERVRSHEDVVKDVQNVENEYIVPMNMPAIGDSHVVGNLVHLSETPGSVKGSCPELGADTSAVMQQLGFSAQQIKQVEDAATSIREQQFAALFEAEIGQDA